MEFVIKKQTTFASLSLSLSLLFRIHIHMNRNNIFPSSTRIICLTTTNAKKF